MNTEEIEILSEILKETFERLLRDPAAGNDYEMPTPAQEEVKKERIDVLRKHIDAFINKHYPQNVEIEGLTAEQFLNSQFHGIKGNLLAQSCQIAELKQLVGTLGKRLVKIENTLREPSELASTYGLIPLFS